MKKMIFLATFVLLAAVACKEKKPAEFTRLGFYTPYQSYMEKLNGNVESVTEIGYWGISEGDSYIKGARITTGELDSISYTNDYKAVFDIDGDLVSSTTYDENDNVIASWKFLKENNILTKAEYIMDDTVRTYVMITCDESGNPFLYESYNALADTLVRKDEVTGFEANDTTVWQYYNYKSEPGTKYILVFNDTGHLMNLEIHRKDEAPGAGNVYAYNDKGFQSEFIAYDKDKNILAKTSTSYEYDDRGNWIKAIVNDDEGFTVIAERVYTYFE